jgi:hypothetical protein
MQINAKQGKSIDRERERRTANVMIFNFYSEFKYSSVPGEVGHSPDSEIFYSQINIIDFNIILKVSLNVSFIIAHTL